MVTCAEIKRSPIVAAARKQAADGYRRMRAVDPIITRLVWRKEREAIQKLTASLYEGGTQDSPPQGIAAFLFN